MRASGRFAGFDGIGRLLLLFVVLALVVVIPFALFGEATERLWSADALVAATEGARSYAWTIVIFLLVVDLLLPVPNTAVIAAAGILYGPFLGGLIAIAGLFGSGLAGYAIAYRYGHPVARWLIGEAGLDEGERLFARSGGWLVICSRWLPVLPEVVSCMAGLSRMPIGRFALSLLCGITPLAFAFAAAGHYGADRPLATLVVAALVPLPVWYVIRRNLGREQGA